MNNKILCLISIFFHKEVAEISADCVITGSFQNGGQVFSINIMDKKARDESTEELIKRLEKNE
jgi:hypothetical protein